MKRRAAELLRPERLALDLGSMVQLPAADRRCGHDDEQRHCDAHIRKRLLVTCEPSSITSRLRPSYGQTLDLLGDPRHGHKTKQTDGYRLSARNGRNTTDSP